ncbi:MAG TPA: hypothetical protein DEP72_04985 [Clostridiales bacterium]|nr:MAG: hypothetical protein A2Y18_02085 [Clostridiales bacterium GWD2_32_19]HCC07495.1 hypothetical protein [Clostridiales bacterium]
MKIEQLSYDLNVFKGEVTLGDLAQWVLVFGNRNLIGDTNIFDKIRGMYPNAYIMGCSSSGEIRDNIVTDESLVLTAVYLEKSKVVFSSFDLESSKDSYEVGKKIINSIEREELVHLFVLAEGININGSKLVDGMRTEAGVEVSITGGLSGDGANFKETCILANEYAKSNKIVVAAFYGEIKTSCASVGGWDTFGPERLVTKSEDNILYEMDGKPALDLYKEYLGDLASELPSSGLLFPLSLRDKDSEFSYVRTILGINEEDKSLIFAGDIPKNIYCRLMKANNDNLINGSKQAGEFSLETFDSESAELAILVSCVGRKLVLKQMVDEEVDIVKETFGDKTSITGFYSYGEISPYKKGTQCELHNQTMTVTLFSE